MIRTALIAVTAMAVAGAASAETRRAPEGQVVATKGRDLSTPAGAKSLYRALVLAAADVCGGAPTHGELAAFDRYDDCFKLTLRQAVAKANAPLVAALAESEPLRARVAGR